MSRYSFLLICIPFLLVPSALAGGNNYKNFDVASYARVIDVQEMKDPAWLERSWAAVTRYVKFDKIYLETPCGQRIKRLGSKTERDLTPANRITDEINREVSPGT